MCVCVCVFAIYPSEKLQEMSNVKEIKSQRTKGHTETHSCISQLIMGQANWKLEHSQIASQLEKSGEMAGRMGKMGERQGAMHSLR